MVAQGPGDQSHALAGSDAGPRWRAVGLYTANNASKNGLLVAHDQSHGVSVERV